MAERDVRLSMALAAGWEDIDLLDEGNVALLPEPLTSALALAARDGEHVRLMMLRALVAFTPSQQAVGMGVAVTLAQPPDAGDGPAGGHDAASLEPGSLELAGAEVSAVTLPVGAGVRVRRLSAPRPGRPATLQVQYALDTEHGLLTLTLTTVQGPDAEEWEPLFDAIASTCEFE